MTAQLLEVRDLCVEFATPAGPLRAVDGVSFTLSAGETLALAGESGCGKSATASALVRLLPPGGRITAGSIHFEGKDVLALAGEDLRALRGRGIGLVFQDPVGTLDPLMTAGAQVEEVLRVHRRISRRAARDAALALLARVRMPEPEAQARRYPHELSGGMCQRVSLAMALACEPRLLIADEPTTALDVTIQAQICALLQSLQAETGMALLLVSHDLALVAGMAARLAVLYAGRIVETGPTRAVLAAPRHPYTRGLVAAMPGIARRDGPLATIPGVLPDPTRLPSHCRFHDRCGVRIERCAHEDPPARAAGPQHSACCFVDLDLPPWEG
jgi:oligopeptide/dipeptide ABC transporter ATP-binding protein